MRPEAFLAGHTVFSREELAGCAAAADVPDRVRLPCDREPFRPSGYHVPLFLPFSRHNSGSLAVSNLPRTDVVARVGEPAWVSELMTSVAGAGTVTRRYAAGRSTGDSAMGEVVGIAAFALFCHMTAAFLVSLARRDNGLADVAYGLGFIVASTTAFLRSGLAHPRQLLRRRDALVGRSLIVALGAPLGWAGVVGPLTILFLLLEVSGIPMLEAKFRGNPEFEDYRARTSAFFPWFPAKREAGC